MHSVVQEADSRQQRQHRVSLVLALMAYPPISPLLHCPLQPVLPHLTPSQVEAAHAALSGAFPYSQRVLGGADGDVAALFEFSRRLDPLMPFDGKHAAQHASLVGEQCIG